MENERECNRHLRQLKLELPARVKSDRTTPSLSLRLRSQLNLRVFFVPFVQIMKKSDASCFVIRKIGAAVRHKQMTGEDSV